MRRALLPAVAAVAGVVTSVVRFLPALLVRVPERSPPAELLSLGVVSGRFVAFLLVYGLALGLAYRIGAGVDGRLALVSGAIAALGHLAGTAVAGGVAGAEFAAGGWLFEAAVALGFAAGTGVELAIVAVAGGAFGRRGAN